MQLFCNHLGRRINEDAHSQARAVALPRCSFDKLSSLSKASSQICLAKIRG